MWNHLLKRITVTPLMTKEYQTSLKNHLDKKRSNFDNYHKETPERKVDKLLVEEPKNCMEQNKLKKFRV